MRGEDMDAEYDKIARRVILSYTPDMQAAMRRVLVSDDGPYALLSEAEDWLSARMREHADSGHTMTNRLAYCAEDDGISATYCIDGAYLRAFAALQAAGKPIQELGVCEHQIPAAECRIVGCRGRVYA